MEYIVASIVGYLFGSFPTAYVLLKRYRQLDITKTGSNNVGAMNSYEVSGSKTLGLFVLVIDAVKGAVSVLLTGFIFGPDFTLQMLALVFAVFAHCYSPWLKFKGGRGLATAAGGVLFISPIIFVVWGIFYIISYIYKRNIHFANLAASVLTAFISYTSSGILNTSAWYTNPEAETNFLYSAFNVIMLLIIISRHLEFIKQYFKKGSIKEGSKDEQI
jgi:glycerol-3-phosphate acyltransferase PlsY